MMGIRIEVRDDETIEQALKRFREFISEHGSPGMGGKRPEWHKRPLDYHLKPSALRRRDRLKDEWITFSYECGRRQLVTEFIRGRKRHKPHFGDRQPIGFLQLFHEPVEWVSYWYR